MKNTKDKTEEFPYDTFPWKLICKEGNEKRTCYFQNEDHMNKHITRYKLNKKNYTISCKYDL